MERTEAAPRQSHDGYQLLVPGDEATAVKEVRIFMIRVVVKLQSFKRRLSEGSRRFHNQGHYANQPLFMTFASAPQFPQYLPWGHCPFIIVS